MTSRSALTLQAAPGATWQEKLAHVREALASRIGQVELTTENVPYDGPEPTQEYLSGDESDRAAGREDDRLWRSLS